MPVTWSVSSAHSRAEMAFIDPYTIWEWREAMLGILATLDVFGFHNAG